MAESLPIRVIDNQKWADSLAEPLQNRVAAALDTAGPDAAKFLHGSWLGHPLHVVLTDVPLGAWTAAAVLDCLEANNPSPSVARGADVAISVGLVGAVAAALTGLADWSKIGGGRPRRVGLAHGMLNLTATLCYGASLHRRNRQERRAGRKFAWLGFILAGASAYLGGHLVYKERLGVDHSAGFNPPEQYVPVLDEAALVENELRKVDAAGMPVLLVRRAERIYAIGETCAHLGGPLSQGTLEGHNVRCPWHGSCFSLEEGRVEGPSTHAQPVLEVRVRDGRIEVRRAAQPWAISNESGSQRSGLERNGPAMAENPAPRSQPAISAKV